MVDAGISSHKMVYGEPKKVLHSIQRWCRAVWAFRDRVRAGAPRSRMKASASSTRKLRDEHRAFVQKY
jgi:hypothetical protein